MGFATALNHLLNFAAPALGLAVCMAVLNLMVGRKRPKVVSIYAQLAINFVVGLTLLAGGLWYFGRDGMMATYAVLVAGVATSQWVMVRGWRT